jgi:hypothetical protein
MKGKARTMSEKDRWRELADLLGLPEDAAPKSAEPAPAPAAQTPAPAREVPPEAAEVEPAPAPEETAEPAPMLREETSSDWEEEFENPEDDTVIDEAPAAEVDESTLAPEESSAEGQSDEGEDGRPRRGRRRRRRGRRRGGDQDEARGPREHQGQHREDAGRSGPPEYQRREPEDTQDVVDEPPARRPSVPTSDTDFSDWNVPSWQDLISALHRPDR